MLRNTLNTFITATLIMLLGVSSSASAQTIVPMGDLMGSTSVTWGNDNEKRTKSSALRVDLVPAEPRIKQVTTDAPDDEQQPGKPVTVTYTITSTANGPDDYALAADYDDGAAAAANLEGPPTTKVLDAGDVETASMNLGVTAAIDFDIETRTITVPYDKIGGAGSVNGIKAGDTVVIGDGDTAYTVADGGVSNPGGEVPSTIRLKAGGDAPSIALGDRIAERNTFKVVVSGVALADPAASGAVSLAVTATSADLTQIGSAPLAFAVTANPIERSFERYVRNLHEARNPGVIDGAGDDLQIQHEGNWYFKEDVSAEEDDEVEILIVMNAGNLADQTGIILQDTLSPFVEYIDGSTLFFANGGEEGASMVRLPPHRFKYKWILELNGKAEATARTFDLAKNTSAYLTYKVKVIGGEEGDDSGRELEVGASVAGGESIEAPLIEGTPWREVVDAGEQLNPGLQACWCTASELGQAGEGVYAAAWADYCQESGWTAGRNSITNAEEQRKLRAFATDTYYALAADWPLWSNYSSGSNSERWCQ